MAEEEVRRYMDGEDLLLKDSILLSQRAEHERQRADRAQQEKERERERADRERQEKEHERREKEHERRRADRERQEKERERERADRERREKEHERQEKEALLARAIHHLHGLGHSAEEIARTLSVEPDEVRRVLTDT